MKYTVTGKQMKAIDRDTIERIGIPSVVLMERAALAVADAAVMLAGEGKTEREKERVRIAAVCGTGNNGADAIAAGRILWGRGYDVTVFLAGDPEKGTEEYKLEREIARRLGIPVKPAGDFASWKGQVILDGLFGIGLGREVEGEYRQLVREMSERRDENIVAVDIPSGIHADTGAVMGAAVRARITVTFGYLKSGLLLYPGREYGGEVQVADIGFSRCSLDRAGWDTRVLDQTDMAGLPDRSPDSNKGTFGKLLVVAGSVGMCGAAYLSGLAAYKVGTGLVKILTVPQNRAILQSQLPEAIVEELKPFGDAKEEAGRERFREEIRRQCTWADAVVLGPGLGQEPYAEAVVETVLECGENPVVLDADGLNIVSCRPCLTKYFTGRVIVTPHMGEMARLTGKEICQIKADRVKAAREYAAQTGAVCVLKDACTVTADREGQTYINTSGCSAMAKAGSGDVLTGVIGGLLAQGMTGIKAAAWGVYLHGLAGEAVAEKSGERSLLARELAESLGRK